MLDNKEVFYENITEVGLRENTACVKHTKCVSLIIFYAIKLR